MSSLMRHPFLVSVFAHSLPLVGSVHGPTALSLLKWGIEKTKGQPESVRDTLAAPACRLINRLARTGKTTLAQNALGAVLCERVGLDNAQAHAQLATSFAHVAQASCRDAKGAVVFSLFGLIHYRYPPASVLLEQSTRVCLETANTIVQQGEDPLPVGAWFKNVLTSSRIRQIPLLRDQVFHTAADLAPEIARTNGEVAHDLLRKVYEEAEKRDAPTTYKWTALQHICNAAHAAADADRTEYVGPLLCLAHVKSRNNAPDTLPDVLRTMIVLAPAVEPQHLGDVFDRMFLEDSAALGAARFESAFKTYLGMTKRLAHSTHRPDGFGDELSARVRCAVGVATDVADKNPEAAHLASRALISSLKLARDLRTRLQVWDGLPHQILCETFNAITKDPPHLTAFGHAAREIALNQTQYHPREVPVFLAEVVGVCSTDPLTDPRYPFVSTLFALTEAYDGKRAAVVYPADPKKPPVVFNGDSRMPLDQIHAAFDRLARNERLLIPHTQWCSEIGRDAPSFVEAITTRHENALIPF